MRPAVRRRRDSHHDGPNLIANWAYDPLMRLGTITATGLASRSIAWDGTDAIVTYQNGQLLARTVYGPGENEPLYQLDNQGRRTWFAADERDRRCSPLIEARGRGKSPPESLG